MLRFSITAANGVRFPSASQAVENSLYSSSEGCSEPNNPVEQTAHSADFVMVRGSVAVGRRSPGALDCQGTLMDVLAENEGKIYGAIAINTPEGFASPFPGALFPCLIWDHDGSFTDTQRATVARALLEAGCRYAVRGLALPGLRYVKVTVRSVWETMRRLEMATLNT